MRRGSSDIVGFGQCHFAKVVLRSDHIGEKVGRSTNGAAHAKMVTYLRAGIMDSAFSMICDMDFVRVSLILSDHVMRPNGVLQKACTLLTCGSMKLMYMLIARMVSLRGSLLTCSMDVIESGSLGAEGVLSNERWDLLPEKTCS
jgi:hypothetical protein